MDCPGSSAVGRTVGESSRVADNTLVERSLPGDKERFSRRGIRNGTQKQKNSTKNGQERSHTASSVISERQF